MAYPEIDEGGSYFWKPFDSAGGGEVNRTQLDRHNGKVISMKNINSR